MRFLIVLLMASLLTATEPHQAMLVDSSGNAYSAWTQRHECLAFNPTAGGLQFVNRGYSPTGDLYVHQTDANFSFWIHDLVYVSSLYGNAHYPTSIAADYPAISFTVIDPITGTWGHKVFIGETGGWFSGFWDPAIDPAGDIGAVRCIGKQLPNGNFIFITVLVDGTLEYEVFSSDLTSQLNSGNFGVCRYWGFDVNGGICYVFYYDPANLNVYYRTTTDGISWSPETQWDITYPTPYTSNYLEWTQMAVTDAGNPILVFDIGDNDDVTYPWNHKTYVHTLSGAAPIQVSDDTYTCSWYPTIAAGGDYVVVLMHVWTNGLEDSLARHDLFYNWSNDNGATWHTPVNITASVPERPGLAQLSKRLDATNGNFFYFYATHMVVNLDIFWMIYSGSVHRLEPVAWHIEWQPVVGIEENKIAYPTTQMPRLQIYPNPFRQITDIRYQITEEVDSRQKSVVSMKIYDATGRLVRQYNQLTNHQSLINHITWQGDDDFGRQVPAGVYFVHLENEHNVIVEKIIKLR